MAEDNRGALKMKTKEGKTEEDRKRAQNGMERLHHKLIIIAFSSRALK